MSSYISGFSNWLTKAPQDTKKSKTEEHPLMRGSSLLIQSNVAAEINENPSNSAASSSKTTIIDCEIDSKLCFTGINSSRETTIKQITSQEKPITEECRLEIVQVMKDTLNKVLQNGTSTGGRELPPVKINGDIDSDGNRYSTIEFDGTSNYLPKVGFPSTLTFDCTGQFPTMPPTLNPTSTITTGTSDVTTFAPTTTAPSLAVGNNNIAAITGGSIGGGLFLISCIPLYVYFIKPKRKAREEKKPAIAIKQFIDSCSEFQKTKFDNQTAMNIALEKINKEFNSLIKKKYILNETSPSTTATATTVTATTVTPLLNPRNPREDNSTTAKYSDYETCHSELEKCNTKFKSNTKTVKNKEIDKSPSTAASCSIM